MTTDIDMDKPPPKQVREALARYPEHTATILRQIRALVFEVAAEHAGIGSLTETLKWGEPAYLTEQTKSGSTLRLGKRKPDNAPTLFVNCNTNLIEQFREIYPDLFDYDGLRGLCLTRPLAQCREELKHCIALTLTYHSRKSR